MLAQAIFVALICLPALLGLFILCGRCRVEWRDQRLAVVDYVGPLRWRRRIPRKPVNRFTVKVANATANGKPLGTGPLADLAALVAEFAEGRPRILVIGYPRDWLSELAGDLSTRVGASLSTTAAPEVIVEDARENPPQFADAPKPSDTRIRVESRLDGFVMAIPAPGLAKGSYGLFPFAIIWCVIIGVITALTLFGKNRSLGSSLGFVPFWLAGLGLTIAAIHMGKRRATLAVEGGNLKCVQIGPFGTKQREWRRGEIAAIRADRSGMEVNNRQVIELQIHPVSGRKVGLFGGRDDDELRWIASELRRALNVPASNN